MDTIDIRKAHEDAVEILAAELYSNDDDLGWDWLVANRPTAAASYRVQARDCLDAALASLHAAGWRVVPVEPTESMLAAYDYIDNDWQDIIAVAPPFPPFPPSED